MLRSVRGHWHALEYFARCAIRGETVQALSAVRFGQDQQIASPLVREVARDDESATTPSLLRRPSSVLE